MKSASDHTAERILVVQTAFLGDCVLTLPLLKAITEQWPEADLSVLGIPASATLFEGVPSVEQVIVFDKRGGDRGMAGTLRLAGRLRREKYDLAIVPHRSFRSALILWLAGIRRRIGFEGVPGSPLYTERFPRNEAAHEGARNLGLLGEAGEHIDPRPRLVVHEESANSTMSWLQSKGLKNRTAIALAPGSVWATKRWPEAYWSELASRLTTAGHPVVLIGGPADHELCERIAGVDPHVFNTAGEMKVLESAELLRQCRLLISGDTAPLHLAVAVETPVLAIFGPTVPEFGFAPTGDHDRIIGLELECRPCAIHGGDECPLGHHDCMKRLAADRVFSTALEML